MLPAPIGANRTPATATTASTSTIMLSRHNRRIPPHLPTTLAWQVNEDAHRFTAWKCMTNVPQQTQPGSRTVANRGPVQPAPAKDLLRGIAELMRTPPELVPTPTPSISMLGQSIPNPTYLLQPAAEVLSMGGDCLTNALLSRHNREVPPYLPRTSAWQGIEDTHRSATWEQASSTHLCSRQTPDTTAKPSPARLDNSSPPSSSASSEAGWLQRDGQDLNDGVEGRIPSRPPPLFSLSSKARGNLPDGGPPGGGAPMARKSRILPTYPTPSRSSIRELRDADWPNSPRLVLRYLPASARNAQDLEKTHIWLRTSQAPSLPISAIPCRSDRTVKFAAREEADSAQVETQLPAELPPAIPNKDLLKGIAESTLSPPNIVCMDTPNPNISVLGQLAPDLTHPRIPVNLALSMGGKSLTIALPSRHNQQDLPHLPRTTTWQAIDVPPCIAARERSSAAQIHLRSAPSATANPNATQTDHSSSSSSSWLSDAGWPPSDGQDPYNRPGDNIPPQTPYPFWPALDSLFLSLVFSAFFALVHTIRTPFRSSWLLALKAYSHRMDVSSLCIGTISNFSVPLVVQGQRGGLG